MASGLGLIEFGLVASNIYSAHDIILINVMCTVNIRRHEAKFYEAEARCHKAEIETRKNEAEAE